MIFITNLFIPKIIPTFCQFFTYFDEKFRLCWDWLIEERVGEFVIEKKYIEISKSTSIMYTDPQHVHTLTAKDITKKSSILSM